MKILIIILLAFFLLGCKTPTEIIIENRYMSIDILQYKLGDIINVYMLNTDLRVIKQFSFTVNGISKTYTGAFGNTHSLILARINKNNCTCHISIDEVVFYP